MTGPNQPDPRHQQYPPQGGYAPPQPAPVKKSRKWPWVLLGICLVPILGFVACSAMLAGAVSSVSGGAATVVYEVIGEGAAGNITYSADGSTGIAQETDAALPWTMEVQFAEGALRVASLTAQNAGGGDITCRITVDGEVVKELTSSGEYAVVSCASDAF